jgi:hypothetical protein
VRTVFGFDPDRFVEAFHFTGDLNKMVGCVKPGDAPDTADAAPGGVPKLLSSDSIRADCPDSRDHYATFHR